MDAQFGYGSFYSVLGVARDSSVEEIRRAYRRLAMQWHPDKWAISPSLLGDAKTRFQKIQEAYSVLSDARKRAMYDSGMYDPTDEVDEGFCDFMQEMLSLMTQVRKEEKHCSLEELRSMFVELAQGFDPPNWFSSPPCVLTNQGWPSDLQQTSNTRASNLRIF